jgi:hypothetical protein
VRKRPRAALLRAKEKSQRWEEELTSGPHLSANERKKKKEKGKRESWAGSTA